VREIASQLRGWLAAGTPFALATVIDVRGSAPREPGAAMAVTAAGEVIGSVSGGCVEGAVYDVAQAVLAERRPALETYGISDETAFSVGLTCGGVLDVLVVPVDPADAGPLAAVLEALQRGERAALGYRTTGPGTGASLALVGDHTVGSLGDDGLDFAVRADAAGMLAQGLTGIRHYGPGGERRRDEVAVFVSSFAPPPRMLVFGAIDFAAAVARIGAFLGYRVTVCDARPVFATAKRFPDAHEVVCEWPHRYLDRTATDDRTVIMVLTHDPKFDVPLLEVALRRPAAYIGAMGSRRTHADRLRRLQAAGVGAEELARLSSPLGLDLGARTPEETAVSIAAELVALRWGGSGRRLSEADGPIHRDPVAARGR
jgi:xanthine dehydrogenase accessory factor